jgi:hypothetical protein
LSYLLLRRNGAQINSQGLSAPETIVLYQLSKKVVAGIVSRILSSFPSPALAAFEKPG